MAMTIDLNNAQFRQFVQFAEMQANPAKSEAVARVTGERDALAGRTITAATNDRVHHWYNYTGARSETNATENNDARALFREAVFSMFGGEANVPENVKGAMKLADYDQGKPLTARRIIAVRDAGLAHLSDPATAKLTSVHFGQTVEMPEREKAVQGNWAHL